jgi:hypothetical protein
MFLAALCLSSSSGAVLIDFDSMAIGNIDGTHIGPSAPDGVTITASDGSAYVANGNRYGYGFISPNNAVTDTGFVVSNPLTFTFDKAWSKVSFYGGDSGGDLDRFWVDAYDSSNNLLATVDTGWFGGNPIDPSNYMVDNYFVMLSGLGGIQKVVVRDVQNFGILIDNLEYSNGPAVPEPSTFLLFGAGLAGAALLRKKFRKQ